jgi:hypothetical protein
MRFCWMLRFVGSMISLLELRACYAGLVMNLRFHPWVVGFHEDTGTAWSCAQTSPWTALCISG